MNMQWVFWVVPVLIVLIGYGISSWAGGEMFERPQDKRAGGCFVAVGVFVSLVWAAIFVSGGMLWEVVR